MSIEEKVPLLDDEKSTDTGGYGSSRKSDSSNKDKIKYEKNVKVKPKTRTLRELFRYATCGDLCLLFLGSIAALINGAGFPLLSIIFGGMTNTFISAENSLDNFASGQAGSNGTFILSSTSPSTTMIMITVNANVTSPPPPSMNISKDAFQEQVHTFSLQYTYLGLAIMVSSYVQVACWMFTCERQIQRIRKEFFKAILRQEISWFDEHQSGELTSQLSDNLERIKEGIGDKFALVLQYAIQFFAGFIIAFIYSWKLTLVMMSLTPLMALSAAFMSKLVSNSARKEQELYAFAGGIAEEALSCIRTVIAFNGQKQECSKYEQALLRGKVTGIRKGMFYGVGLFFTFFIMFSSYALAFWYGSLLILWNELLPGTVFVVFFSVMTGSFSLGNAAPIIGTVATAKGAAESIFNIIDEKPTIDGYSKEGKKPSSSKGKVEFNKVRFSYPTRKEVTVLDGISFSVEPGENVALVGPSGCGKSTVVNLLLRYYDVNSGQLTIDGENIKDLNVRWLRNLVGVVSQEPVLFDASIAENIRFGRLNVSMDEMIEKAKMANAHTFIMELPEGYNTRVGERGTQLSGGQKQRIAIARALVRDPKILLLDEATSALDAESEGVVQEALDKAQQGRTTIVIAHRLSTIRNAQKIIALKEGHIAEIGTHVELMNLKGLYYDLVTTQLFDSTTSEYASAADETETKVDSDDSGTSVDVTQARKKSLKRQHSLKRGSVVSSVGSGVSSRVSSPRKLTRMLSKIDTEKERLEQELKEENLRKSTLTQMMKANKSEWFYITMGMLGAVVRGAIMPAFAFFYSQIFEAYSKTGDDLKNAATFWAIMFLIIGAMLGASMFICSYFFGLSGETLTMRLRLNVFKNILRQDVSYFDESKHSTGRICTRLSTDAPNIKAAVGFGLSTVLSSFISMTAGIVIAFIYGWKLALLVLALAPIMAAGGYLNSKLRHGTQETNSKNLEDAGKVAAEGIENIRTVQALTREKTFYETFCSHLTGPYKQSLKQTQIHAVSYGFAQSIPFFLYAASFSFGGYLIGIGDMTPMDVFKVFFAITFCGMTISWATAYFPEFYKAQYSAALIFKMLEEVPKIDSYSQSGVKPPIKGTVFFKDVHFAYPTRPDTVVLNGLDFSVNRSQSLALVGGSGCGKSTVVNLLERFYDPQHGQIGIDEYDIKLVNVGYMRQNIALVSQEPVLFNCSIIDNITYGLEDVPHDKVVEAAKNANIHEFILSLPDGYNTRVGEKGTMLSGGQKQRVAIARALVRDPKILLLDEATSALDTESEKIVQEALDRARQGRTCIIIAHRLSTIQGVDKIAVIKSGKVVEIGSHGELVAKHGAYFNLTKKQNVQQ